MSVFLEIKTRDIFLDRGKHVYTFLEIQRYTCFLYRTTSKQCDLRKIRPPRTPQFYSVRHLFGNKASRRPTPPFFTIHQTTKHTRARATTTPHQRHVRGIPTHSLFNYSKFDVSTSTSRWGKEIKHSFLKVRKGSMLSVCGGESSSLCRVPVPAIRTNCCCDRESFWYATGYLDLSAPMLNEPVPDCVGIRVPKSRVIVLAYRIDDVVTSVAKGIDAAQTNSKHAHTAGTRDKYPSYVVTTDPICASAERNRLRHVRAL